MNRSALLRDDISIVLFAARAGIKRLRSREAGGDEESLGWRSAGRGIVTPAVGPGHSGERHLPPRQGHSQYCQTAARAGSDREAVNRDDENVLPFIERKIRHSLREDFP